MEYEYSIQCICGSTSAGGGFSSPVNFTDEEVLSRTWHNGGCPVQESGQGVISHQTDPDAPNVTDYVIASIDQ